MPTGRVCTSLIAALACAGAWGPCCADTVYLVGGDRISGKILHKAGDSLTVKTDYAGEIKLPWSKILSMVTDSPVTLQVEGAGPPMKAKLAGGQPGQLALDRSEAAAAQAGALAVLQPEAVPLARVLFINPLPEETADGVAYHRRITLSAAETAGNSVSEHLNADAAFNARARDHRYDIDGHFNRAREAGVDVAKNWLMEGNYDHFLDPKRFVYWRGSLEKDDFKGLDRRTTAGGGYGRQLLDTPQSQLSLRGGLDYVETSTIGVGVDHYPSLGWGIKYMHKLNLDSIEVFHEQDGFWNINDSSQVTLRTRSGLRLPLITHMLASVQLNVDWDRRPAPGRKPTDSTLLFGLGYEW